MLNRLLSFLNQWLQARRLFRNRWTHNLNHLYWYDLPLRDVLSWPGLFKVLRWNLTCPQQDDIASNYGVVNLYRSAPVGEGLDAPAPIVWHCRSLTPTPWHQRADLVKELLENHAKEIIAEYKSVASSMVQHPDDESLTGGGRWEGLFFFGTGGERNEELCRRCPTTARVLASLPLCFNFGFVMFSQLRAGSEIFPHRGSSNLRLRYHLGIEIPEGEDVRIRVGREWYGWQQDKVIAFDDAFEHEVIHNGESTRVVLVVDVWQPELTVDERLILGHPLFGRFGKADRSVFTDYRQRIAYWSSKPETWMYRGARILKGPSKQAEVRRLLRQLYPVVNEFLRELGVEYWLECGTLLGYHREGDIIAGDQDVDFAAMVSDYDKIWNERHRLPSEFKMYRTGFKYGSPKLFVSYRGLDADIYFYRRNGDSVVCPVNDDFPCYRAPMPSEFVFPLNGAEFLGDLTKVPGRVEEYLVAKFGYLGSDAVQDRKTGYWHKR